MKAADSVLPGKRPIIETINDRLKKHCTGGMFQIQIFRQLHCQHAWALATYCLFSKNIYCGRKNLEQANISNSNLVELTLTYEYRYDFALTEPAPVVFVSCLGIRCFYPEVFLLFSVQILHKPVYNTKISITLSSIIITYAFISF